MAREQATHPAFQRSYDVSVDTSKCSPAEAAAEIRASIAAQDVAE
jgi:chloramphenicol 3-O-phosphotransferase